jgi:hypothetical protein
LTFRLFGTDLIFTDLEEDTDEAIPVPNVDGVILAAVVEYMTHHKVVDIIPCFTVSVVAEIFFY